MAEQPENEERTEQATPRRREEAREKGQVAFSSEATVAAMLAGAVLSFLVAGGELAQSMGRIVREGLAHAALVGPTELELPGAAAVARETGESVLPALLAFVLPMLAIGLVVGYAQVGFRIAPRAVAPDLAKLNPLKGLQRLFSSRSLVRTSLAAIKIVVILSVVVWVTWNDVGRLSALPGAELGPLLGAVGRALLRVALASVAVVVVLAVLDLLYQRHQHGRDLRMSKKEVRDEQKTTEGDPHVKARIRRIQRELAARRMMADVPDATVVVTNPTHFAVALAYDEATSGAPRVVAKGVDEIARKIREVAEEAGVLVYEDPPLARALHRQAEIGDEVPEELFQAVAGVLAYVYRVQEIPVGAR